MSFPDEKKDGLEVGMIYRTQAYCYVGHFEDQDEENQLCKN